MIKKLVYITPEGLYNWRGTPASDKDISISVGIRVARYPRLGDTTVHHIIAKIYKLKYYTIIQGEQ